jgi:hypothetical protein
MTDMAYVPPSSRIILWIALVGRGKKVAGKRKRVGPRIRKSSSSNLNLHWIVAIGGEIPRHPSDLVIGSATISSLRFNLLFEKIFEAHLLSAIG